MAEAKPSMFESMREFIFGNSIEIDMPERIMRDVRNEQNRSEILVGWIQLILVCIFVALYSLSPKMSAPGAFQAVPWALGLYLGLTVMRLVASYKCALPGWVLMGSIILDMGLLMTLIWSFHIQYDQPPSFYLKAPTLLYVFIFIALRALRYEPRYVLLAGGAAVVGWMALVAFVMFSNPTDPMITRNYVDYMTSNSVLLGAEVDKLLSIVVVTMVLAIGLQRGRIMMCRAAMDQVAARDLSRFVPREIADQIVHSEEKIMPGDGTLKVATALFTDIEGFSKVSEKLQPNELVGVMNAYFGAIYEIATRHGGVINQYHGDALLILFNAASDDTDHAVDAIRTALEIERVMAHQKFGNGLILKTRCGINTGEMTVGTIGAEDMLLFTVYGDEVNIAARLEQLNKEYGTYVMVSAQTRDAAIACDENLFSYKHLGNVVVRGRSMPTDVYGVAEIGDKSLK
jgi:adenylate cyclase